MTEQLPIEIEVFLMNHGFYEPSEMPDFHPYRFKHNKHQMMFVSTTPERIRDRNSNSHAKVYIAEPREEYVAWRPSFDGEQPPF